jgi:hypothetical protein
MKLRLLARIDDTNAWTAEGHRSAAHLLAAESGVSVGQAMKLVETARRLHDQSRVQDAVRTGQLSESQTREVSEAAHEDPEAERELLDIVNEDGFAGLKKEAERVKANARTAEQEAEREERIQRTRYVDHWIDAEGAGRGEWKLPKPAHTRLVAALRVEQDRIFKAARAEGRHEPQRAYAADALVALAEHSLDGGPAKKSRSAKARVIARVDLAAVRRGTTIPGEVCEIKGAGPVSAEDMRDLLGDALLDIVLTDGVDVMNVTRIGRTTTAEIRTALEWLYTECGVRGCNQTAYLERHHTDDYAKTRHTKLSELVPLCKHHHKLVTHRRFTIKKRPDGQYDLIPPPIPANARLPMTSDWPRSLHDSRGT